MSRKVYMVGVWVVCSSVATPAGAQTGGAVPPQPRARQTVRGPVSTLQARPVVVRGERATLGELATRALADHRGLVDDLRQSPGALVRAPTTDEEVVDTDTTVTITARTRVLVKDAKRFALGRPRLSALRRTGARVPRLQELSAPQRAELQRIRAELQAAPAEHPLRAPAQKGDQELLEAISQGLGELEVATTVVIPKQGISPSARTIEMPRLLDGGVIDSAHPVKRQVRHLREPTSGLIAPTQAPATEPPASQTNEYGSAFGAAEFVNGFTHGLGMTWSRSWSGSGWRASINASAVLGAGFRVPVVVVGMVEPNLIVTTGAADEPGRFTNALQVKTMDADAQYYRARGVPEHLIFGGQEIVLEAGVSVTVYAKALGKVLLDNKKFGASVDYGSNCTPAMDKQGSNTCSTSFWVPAHVTQTDLRWGPLSGKAEIGVRVAGTGEVRLGFESWFGDRAVPSVLTGAPSAVRHSLLFKERGKERPIETTLPALGTFGEQPFGFRASDVEYLWNVELTPGVRGEAKVDFGFFDKRFSFGPLFVDAFKVRPGQLTLRHHEGTAHTQVVTPGVKRFRSASPPRILASGVSPRPDTTRKVEAQPAGSPPREQAAR